MKGLERFQTVMIRAAQSYLLPLFERDRKQLGAALRNELFNLEGPRVVERTSTARDRFMGKVFRGFREIQKCAEALEDIALYVGRFPYKNTRVTPERHLQFCVEAYLSEVYILRERLVAYLSVVQRQYRGEVGLRVVVARCRSVLKDVMSSLDGVVRVRGAHVHKYRFTDPDIDRLGTISLLSQSGDDDLSRALRPYFRAEYRTVRDKWRHTLFRNNKTVILLLDSFFDELHALMFEKETQALRFPKGTATQREDEADEGPQATFVGVRGRSMRERHSSRHLQLGPNIG